MQSTNCVIDMPKKKGSKKIEETKFPILTFNFDETGCDDETSELKKW